MLGGLSLSFAGQVDAVAPLLGRELAIVFAATNDVAALLALNEVLNPVGGRGVRGWAWVALILGGGTALVLNTWHAIKAAVLPAPAAILVGAEPVVLAWVLSHVVALVLTRHREAADGSASEETAEGSTEAAKQGVSPEAEVDVTEAAGNTQEIASGAGQSAVPQAGGAAVNEEFRPAGEALPEAPPTAAEAVPEALIDRAEKAERKALERSDGKRGLSYREAPRKLGVRYATARAALDAARTRMTSETPLTADQAA